MKRIKYASKTGILVTSHNISDRLCLNKSAFEDPYLLRVWSDPFIFSLEGGGEHLFSKLDRS